MLSLRTCIFLVASYVRLLHYPNVHTRPLRFVSLKHCGEDALRGLLKMQAHCFRYLVYIRVVQGTLRAEGLHSKQFYPIITSLNTFTILLILLAHFITFKLICSECRGHTNNTSLKSVQSIGFCMPSTSSQTMPALCGFLLEADLPVGDHLVAQYRSNTRA